MAYQVLARKYRPQRFSDVAGQDHVTRTLLNALAQRRIAHGYIFSGHRGIGKTTIARILAMALNCRREIGSPQRPTPEPCESCESCTEVRAGNAVDVIEIDAATNRGIDEIRELRDAARYRPARDRYKIYILDEAHQITDAAFNALLKTLEEPPDHVIFMMATTQPEDIPQTIRSRSQHFSFHAVSFENILKELRAIAAKENVGADETALALLAEAGDGSMRDALSIMDQAIASAPLTEGKAHLSAEQIRELMGTVPNTVFEKLLERVSESDSAAVIGEVNTLLNAGNSASQIARQLVRYLRNALMAKLGGENTQLLEISSDERARANRTAMLFSEEDLTRFLQLMLRTFDDLNYRQEPRFHLELGLMKLVHLQRLLPVEELLSQLARSSANSPGATRTGPPPRALATPRTEAPSVATTRMPHPSDPGSPTHGPGALGWEAGVGTTSSPASAIQPEKPSFSPFEADRNRKRGEQGFAPESNAPRTAPQALEAPAQPGAGPMPIGSAVAIAEEEAPPTPPSQSSLDLARIRDAVVAALAAKGHHTAAALLAEGKWTDRGDTLEAEIGVKVKMLGLVMSPEADKIARGAVREAGVQRKLQVIAGEGSGTGPASSRPVSQGSIQALALENPLVKQAQELFRAEVRSVLDLREKQQ